MTALSDMSAAGTRLLDLLTASEAAARIPDRCSLRKVRRLADEGVLERVRFGPLVRFTPESVAAYKRARLIDRIMDEELPRFAEALKRLGE